MKSSNRCAFLFSLTVFALLVAGISQPAWAGNKPAARTPGIFANGRADGAQLIIKRSPVLGNNVSISLYIDGQVAGTSVRDRDYDRYIKPGRHVLVASPSHMGDDWRGVLDMRAGQTFVFVASYSTRRLFLDQVPTSR